MANKNLHAVKTTKRDEFFTELTDIEKELYHYCDFFRGKIVFCNCDDPEYSNFWKYFQMNFFFLGLKKLISTHYEPGKQSYKMEIIATDLPIGQTAFPEEECIEILKEADVVITSPQYDNYDAINVDKTCEIPEDHDEVMGVPITFLDKYCSEQFEIINFRKGNDDKDLCVNGKCPYFRILIRRRIPSF